MKSRATQSTIFKKIIQSDKSEVIKLIDGAMAYFNKIQQSGLALEISEFNFRLALDEAIENAISHGNGYNPEKKIYITIKGFKNKLDITVEDEGAGFKPEADPGKSLKNNFFSPHGRGLCLLNKIGTIQWNKKGNSINVILID
jgi:anti-sigma regulatory factor (Ser/Thr protein kinase)